MAYDPKWIRDDDAVKRDGTNDLTGDWDIGDARKILLDELRIRDTSGLTVSDTTGNVVANITNNGLLSLGSGVGVNEFSSDTSLAQNSDAIIPTQKAIRSYVDTQIGDIQANKISADDSYIEVVDSTSAESGEIDIVIDGVNVGHYDDTAFRLGPATASNVFVGADNCWIDVNASPRLKLHDTNQTLGDDTDTYVYVDKTANQISFYTDNALRVSISIDGLTLQTGETVNNISNSLLTDTTSSLLTSEAIHDRFKGPLFDPNLRWETEAQEKTCSCEKGSQESNQEEGQEDSQEEGQESSQEEGQESSQEEGQESGEKARKEACKKEEGRSAVSFLSHRRNPLGEEEAAQGQ